jgi:hypothetical protein
LTPTLYPSGFGSSRASSSAFASPTSAMSAPCSAAVHSKNVGATRRVITSTCPGDTGNESKIEKQRLCAHATAISARPGTASSPPLEKRTSWARDVNRTVHVHKPYWRLESMP